MPTFADTGELFVDASDGDIVTVTIDQIVEAGIPLVPITVVVGTGDDGTGSGSMTKSAANPASGKIKFIHPSGPAKFSISAIDQTETSVPVTDIKGTVVKRYDYTTPTLELTVKFA